MKGRDAETRKDDLKTGTPYWLDTKGISVPVRAAPGRDHFDVIVVGAGISGALVAEALTRAGRSVLILDRRNGAMQGSTPASTAMIQHEIDVPLSELSKQRGARAANAAWRRSAAAVNDLIELVSTLDIRCQMQRKPALLLAGDQMDGDQLRKEAATRRRAGIEAEWIHAEQLKRYYGIDRDGAILSQASASANPAQMTSGILRAVKSRGALIAAPVEVTDVAELPGGVALATRDGRVLTAGHAVFCTGYEFLRQMRSRSHKVTSTWALATRQPADTPAWMKDTIVWEASDPYLYFRTSSSGFLVAGGEDEEASDRSSDDDILDKKARTIIVKLEKLTGLKLGNAEYRWAAPFGVTTDGLPIIDRVEGYENVFAVMGFGGNGITFSMIAAQIIAAAIDGRSDSDASIFRMR